MGDCLRAGLSSHYVTSQLGQLSFASLQGRLIDQGRFSWGNGGNITSAGWKVTLCDHIWHVSSSSGEASCELLYSIYLYLHVLVLPFWYRPTRVVLEKGPLNGRVCLHVLIIRSCRWSRVFICGAGIEMLTDYAGLQKAGSLRELPLSPSSC